jgi:ParB family chromosome partitioning protein
MPCAILESGDNADAIEASLIENSARLDPDEVTRWECFTRLVREGRCVEELSTTFGLPDLAVRRILALGNLLPRIREALSPQGGGCDHHSPSDHGQQEPAEGMAGAL